MTKIFLFIDFFCRFWYIMKKLHPLFSSKPLIKTEILSSPRLENSVGGSPHSHSIRGRECVGALGPGTPGLGIQH